MPDEPSTPAPYEPRRRVGTGFAGETTRNEGSTIRRDAGQRPLEVIGDFEVLAKLGQGGMGAVYRARQVSLDRLIALKILPSNFEADADYVSRFQREARVAASLSHANLVKVYAAGVADGCHYIAMELIEGETLSQWIQRPVRPPLESLRIILDVARALEYGWRSAQLIHRDIKPGNIFLSADGAVKLGDLGLAKIIGSDSTGLTQTGTAMGTPHYISPEQARGDKELDFRADIYSLGCTLYQMVTQRTPYGGSDAMTVMSLHRDGPPPAILKVMPQCPLPLARLVSKMLKKQRRERPASYEELIAALESVRAQLDPALTATIMASRSAAVEEEAVADETPKVGMDRRSIPVQGTLGERSLPGKSKLPLYGGIGVLALAAAAFFLWPKTEKLTKAQIYAREHAAGQQAQANAPAGASAAVAADTGRAASPKPPGALGESTLPDAATKDAPFVNTWGMKFVPVPIIGGPTGGQRVLFSVWQTRTQDFAHFAGTTRTWPKPDFPQDRTHPAVNVTWQDAHAFCDWLTEYERKAGKLGANERYRLPSDHEWSCAVGIGEREDAAQTPEQKNGKINDVFPWGTQWPPPVGAGNYSGEETRGKEIDKQIQKAPLAGYRDDFIATAPVGSFPANRFGLFDLGGNVWEWCEDWMSAAKQSHALRGGSWAVFWRPGLLSSSRSRNPANGRDNDCGFRCVLAPAASTAPVTHSTANYPQPRVWIDATDEVRQRGLKEGALVVDGEWLMATKDSWQSLADGKRFRDTAVRVVFSGHIDFYMRKSGKTWYWGGVWKRAGISLYDEATKERTDLMGAVELGTAYVEQAAHELVFAAQGDQLGLWLDGKEMVRVRDTALTAGITTLYLNKDMRPAPRIKKVEYGELEAGGTGQVPTTPAAASAKPAADSQTAAAFPPGQWVKPVPDFSKLSILAEFKDGWALLNDSGQDFHVRRPQSQELAVFRNGGLRVQRQAPQGWHGGVVIVIRREIKQPRMFELHWYPPDSTRAEGSLQIREYRPDLIPSNSTAAQRQSAEVKLAEKKISATVGAEFTAELVAIGKTLVARVNGETLTCTVDDGDRAGSVAVLGANKLPLRDLEVLNLDGLSEAEALKAAGLPAVPVSSSPR